MPQIVGPGHPTGVPGSGPGASRQIGGWPFGHAAGTRPVDAEIIWVDAGERDAAETSGGVVTLNDINIQVDTAHTNWAGLSFRNVPLAQGATVTAATLNLYANAGKAFQPDVDIYCEAVDTGTNFAATTSNISGRTRTTAVVTWTASAVLAANGYSAASIDISAVINEVLARPGWVPGNTLNVLIHARSTTSFQFATFDSTGAGGTGAVGGTGDYAPFLAITAVSPTGTDTGAGSDAGEAVAITDTDTGLGSDAGETLTVASTDTDVGAGTDAGEAVALPASIVTTQIAASSDDSRQKSDGTNSLTDTTITVVNTSGASDANYAGFRFTNIAVAQAATVTAAPVSFYFTSAKGLSPDVDIYAQAIDNAPTFTTTANDLSTRARTTAKVTWTASVSLGWNTVDVAPVVAEVVNRPGWTSGNAIALILVARSTSIGIVDAYDDAPSRAAAIEIDTQVAAGTESGAGADAGEALALTDTDTGAGSDAGEALASSDTETGAGSDAGEALTALATDAETANGTEAGEAVAISDTDAVAGTDAGESLTAVASDAETGSGTDAGEAIALTDTDAVGGTDAGESSTVTASDAETGSGVDAGEAVAFADTDTATGLDDNALAVTDADAASATDASEAIAQSDTDAGTGTDSGEAPALADADTATFAETESVTTTEDNTESGALVDNDESLTATSTDTDTAVGTDTGETVELVDADAATAADTELVAASPADTDTFVAADGTEQAALTDDEATTGADAGETLTVADDDLGAVTDAGEAVAFADDETTSSAESEHVDTGVSASDADTFTAVETETIDVAATDTDTATGADAGEALALSDGDVVVGIDDGSSTTTTSDTEAGTVLDAGETVDLALTDTDTAVGAETSTLEVTNFVTDDDTLTAADAELACDADVADADVTAVLDAAEAILLDATDTFLGLDGGTFDLTDTEMGVFVDFGYPPSTGTVRVGVGMIPIRAG